MKNFNKNCIKNKMKLKKNACEYLSLSGSLVIGLGWVLPAILPLHIAGNIIPAHFVGPSDKNKYLLNSSYCKLILLQQNFKLSFHLKILQWRLL